MDVGEHPLPSYIKPLSHSPFCSCPLHLVCHSFLLIPSHLFLFDIFLYFPPPILILSFPCILLLPHLHLVSSSFFFPFSSFLHSPPLSPNHSPPSSPSLSSPPISSFLPSLLHSLSYLSPPSIFLLPYPLPFFHPTLSFLSLSPLLPPT